MDEDNKAHPITSETIVDRGDAKPADDQGKVSVKALSRFHEDADMKGRMLNPGDTFETTRARASELRANGLIEYANEADEKDIHGRAAEHIAKRADARKEQGAIKDKDKSSPLKNPHLAGQDD